MKQKLSVKYESKIMLRILGIESRVSKIAECYDLDPRVRTKNHSCIE